MPRRWRATSPRCGRGDPRAMGAGVVAPRPAVQLARKHARLVRRALSARAQGRGDAPGGRRGPSRSGRLIGALIAAFIERFSIATTDVVVWPRSRSAKRKWKLLQLLWARSPLHRRRAGRGGAGRTRLAAGDGQDLAVAACRQEGRARRGRWPALPLSSAGRARRAGGRASRAAGRPHVRRPRVAARRPARRAARPLAPTISTSSKRWSGASSHDHWAVETLVATTVLIALVLVLRGPVARAFRARAPPMPCGWRRCCGFVVAAGHAAGRRAGDVDRDQQRGRVPTLAPVSAAVPLGDCPAGGCGSAGRCCSLPAI